MNCIFCKANSSESRSVEHVIPESLGNTEHVLKPGAVCDQCNNYFASKVEGPLLSDPYLRYQCSQADIASKKGRPVRVRGLHPQSRSVIEVVRNLDGSGISVGAAFEKDENRWAETVLRSDEGRIYIPHPTSPDVVLMSRFLAKVAIECLALKLIEEDGGLDAVLSEPALDPLRNYARRGPPTPIWPFHSRTLYPPDFGFSRPGQEPYEVLHEWLFTGLGGNSLYFVLGLFGVEYTLNLSEREVESYTVWLNANSEASPLYPRGIEHP
jgi:HNH endonuclease